MTEEKYPVDETAEAPEETPEPNRLQPIRKKPR